MLRFVPLASPLNRSEVISSLTQKLIKQIRGLGIKAELSTGAPEEDHTAPRMLMILTGGTEGQALAELRSWSGPVVLLAHPTHNSLPAALEILAKIHQMDRRGKIVFLGDDEQSQAELLSTLTLMKARQNLWGKRLGRIGTPSEWLIASMPEDWAVEKSWGVELVDIPKAELLSRVELARPEGAAQLVQKWKEGAKACVEPGVAELAWAGRVYAGLRGIIQDQKLDASAVRCFDLVTELKTTGCMALSELIDEGHMASCEGDVPAAMTMMWMHALTGAYPFMANPQQVLQGKNALWLAHCTIARKLVSGYTLRSHFESGLGVAIQGASKEKKVTLARLAGPGLTELFVSDGEIIEDGNSGDRCRTQYLVKLHQPVQTFLEHPLGNHHVLIPGHFAALLTEYKKLYL